MSLDLKALGDKIKRCRSQLQLDVNEVTSGTGIPKEKIVLFENGQAEPTGDEILILADFFKQDYLFFISNQKLSAAEQVDILYRKFGNAFTKEDRRVIQEFIYACECEQFIWDELKIVRNSFLFKPVGSYFKAHGEQAAAQLRKLLGYKPDEIIDDIYAEFRKINLHIFRRRLKNSDISGLFIAHPYAGRCILVNYDEDVYRQKFTVAHEVGHSIFDSNDSTTISFKTGNFDIKEIRANSFASNFLIPKQALKNLKIGYVTEEIVIKIAQQLKVNIQPVVISLKEAGLISEEESTKFSHTRIHKSEKEDPELFNASNKVASAKKVVLEKGLSSFYVSNCYEAYQQGIITERRLAEMLFTSETELPQVLEIFSYKLNYGN